LLAVSDTVVEPAYRWVPEHTTSAGAEAAELAASAGLVLYPEQRLALDVLLAERASGKWAALEACIICPRQNGKTVSIQAAVLADLYLFGARTVVWSAHEVNTALEAFRDMKELIESNDHLAREIKRTKTGEIAHEANGKEGFEFRNGARLLFKARTRTGGRGLSGDRVVLDEAFALKPAMIGSLMPLLSAQTVTGNPQIVYASSAGHSSSTVLRNLRDRGRAGGDPSLAYVEWCAPVVACADDWCDHSPRSRGCALDDEQAWRRANPLTDRRIDIEYLRMERRSMPAEEFVRERLGWWDEPQSVQGGVPLELWDACGRSGATVDSPVSVAVDVTPEFSHAAVAVAAGGTVELVAHERGTSWVAALVRSLVDVHSARLVVDMRGPASVLGPELAAVGLDPVKPSGLDMAQACGAFLDGVVRGSLHHGFDDDLDLAIRGAKRVESGDSFKWSRKSSTVDISPLVAATLASWGASHTSVDAHEPFMVVT
jgi:hypothetical protein